MNDLSAQKQALRRLVRSRFPGMAQRDAESRLLCEGIAALPRWQAARTVAAYMPLPWEADITSLMLAALAAGKTLILPRVQGGALRFHRADSLDSLMPGAWGIPEPAAEAPEADPALADLMLVPLEAADGLGRRLGKGGGFYDRLLRASRPRWTLGCALSWQMVDRVPAGPLDEPLDEVFCAAGRLDSLRADR